MPLYDQLVCSRLLWISSSYCNYKYFHDEFIKFTYENPNNWKLALGSISQSNKGRRYCNLLVDDLWCGFSKEDYLQANKAIFTKELCEAIHADDPWNHTMERFNGTFIQKFVFLTRYALNFETPAFMYRRVALFTYLSTPTPLRFSVNVYYFNLLRQHVSPSSQILRHAGTILATESCAIIREPCGTLQNKQQSKMRFMEQMHVCIKNYLDLGIELKSMDYVQYYIFLVGLRTASSRNILCNFNQSIGDVRLLDILKKINTNVDSPLQHLVTIGILDDFMTAIIQNDTWGMYNTDVEIFSSDVYRNLASTSTPEKTMPARDLLNLICNQFLKTGKLSIIFLDTMNKFSQFPTNQTSTDQRSIGGSNPCTEISLPMKDDEHATCWVGAMNLKKVFISQQGRPSSFDHDLMKLFRGRVLCQMDIMNSVHSTSSFAYSRQYRPLAIGLMGFCDMFPIIKNKGTYSAAQVTQQMELFMESLYVTAISRSCDWAQHLESFRDFDQSSWARGQSQVELRQKSWKHCPDIISTILERSKQGMFNLTLTAQPPTASIALLCNCLPGIEMPLNGDGKNETVTIKMASYKFNVNYNSMLNAYRNAKLAMDLAVVQSTYLDQSSSQKIFIDKNETTQLVNYLGRMWAHGQKTGSYYTRTEPKMA